MIFFTADTHFNHTNIIQYCKRPFADLVEMNKVLISAWNKVVSPSDVVYHLGDFGFFKSATAASLTIEKLNGHINLILGNHDRRKNYWGACSVLENITEVKAEGYPPIICSHYPLEIWDKSQLGSWHLHGHTHNTLTSPTKLRLDVGVDACHDYAPVSLPQIARFFELKGLADPNWTRKLPGAPPEWKINPLESLDENQRMFLMECVE